MELPNPRRDAAKSSLFTSYVAEHASCTGGFRMNDQSRLGIGARLSAVRLAAALLAIAGFGAASGCLTRPIQPIDVRTTSVVVKRLTQGGVDKIDLVLAVDNSASMADKQQILALAVPDLITGLVNPKCLDNATGQPTATQPAGPTDQSCGSQGCSACPPNSTREFPPVLDIHVGLISSSLGTFGANGCEAMQGAPCVAPLNDQGHLVTRADACNSTGPIPTYQSQGFLAWDPAQKLNPPGLKAVGSPGTVMNGMVTVQGTGIVGTLQDLVVGNGQSGCGWESQNEAWYRFLIDPTPYESIQFVNNIVQVSGIDQALLKQRQEFLRPDSLLAIVLLSDETDDSIKQSSFYPLFGTNGTLPRARQECATKGPTDPCCSSCGLPTPKGCPVDPVCASNPNYTSAEDSYQLRAFGLISHKQRYGIEFMYQPSRYVNALTSQTIKDINGQDVANPIYTNLDPTHYTGAVRNSGLVFYAAIVGVPWQLIARKNAMGQPNLINGVSDVDPTQVGGFKTAKELSESDGHGSTYWDDIAGDPERYVPARSPFMVESTTPRKGTDPITGVAISPETTPNGSGNPLNDHEWTISTPVTDIEYACIFPLMQPRDESGGANASGDCANNPKDNPLCSPNPNDPMGATRNTLQTKFKAYPGIKHLAIARGMGSQGIVGSICPAQLSDASKPDYGYRPAVKAIIDRLKQALHGECLPRTLNENAEGQVQCLILEGTKTDTCQCNPSLARSVVSPEHLPAVQTAQADAVGKDLNCFCEINQLCNAGTPGCTAPAGADLHDCQTATQSQASGWCYVDAAYGADQANLVKPPKCPATEEHEIRFVGKGQPRSGSTLFITCAGE
jgi:hypothetical protein